MDKLYLSGQVLRIHTRSTIKSHTIAEHTWGVLKHIYCMYPQASTNLIWSAQFHDSPEFLTGDLPAPFIKSSVPLQNALKRAETQFLTENVPNYADIMELAQFERLLLQIADRLEFVDMCSVEAMLGNTGLAKNRLLAIEWIHNSIGELSYIDKPLSEKVAEYVEQQTNDFEHEST